MERKRAPEDPAGTSRLAPLVKARWREYRFAQPTDQDASILCIAGSNGMLKQPSSKERETLRGCSKDCTVAKKKEALSASAGREPANRFVVKPSLGSLTTASSLKDFCNGVSPQDAVSSSLCSLRKWSLTRRLPHLADHHDSEEETAWGSSLRSIACTRHQRGQSIFHCLLSAVGMVAGHTTAVGCHRRCGLDAVDLCASCGVPRYDLHIAQFSLCRREMSCHICVEARRCPFHV